MTKTAEILGSSNAAPHKTSLRIIGLMWRTT